VEVDAGTEAGHCGAWLWNLGRFSVARGLAIDVLLVKRHDRWRRWGLLLDLFIIHSETLEGS
jgi:hypothetical protein